MKHIVLSLLAAATAVTMSSAVSAATYVYAGSWHVGDGADWTTSPTVYTGQQAAALLFGGAASDYAISTNGTDVNTINFMSFVDGYGVGINNAVAQNFSADADGQGYNNRGDFSAFVHDNSCFNRYSDFSQKCAANEPGLNFAFRIAAAAPAGAVPEPASWAMMILGMGAVGFAMRRKMRLSNASFDARIKAITFNTAA